jgi:hypothetical protein
MAQVLEAISEPILRDCSSGFRPGRNPIQALRPVAQGYPAGATWIIEGELVQCVDSFPPGVILHCVRQRIKDERCRGLVRTMLPAGVRAEGEWLPTSSGTPLERPTARTDAPGAADARRMTSQEHSRARGPKAPPVGLPTPDARLLACC